MRRTLALSLVLAAVSGCSLDNGGVAATPQNDLFVAREVKLHPVFTKISDWTGDGRADGVEALVELHDQFGDTTKGTGTFMFELFELRRDQPDPRGKRISNPWIADVLSADQQRARWSKTSRCYTFRLQSDAVARGGPYVFTVTYTPTSGPRAFDRVVLGGLPVPDKNDAGSNDSTPDATPGTKQPSDRNTSTPRTPGDNGPREGTSSQRP